MANKFHKDMVDADNHVIHFVEYANTAARTGATGLVAADIGKVAKQTNDNTYWILTATTPTWTEITSTAAGGGIHPIADNTPIVKGSGDGTKEFRIEVDGFTTGVTRVMTPPDANFSPDDASASRPPNAHTHTESEITDLDHTDTDAIHDNISGEISAVAEKVSPGNSDKILIEDDSDGDNKKHIQIQNLPVHIHELGGGAHIADTLAALNALITDANLDDEGDSRPPDAHTHTESEITDLVHNDDFNVKVSADDTTTGFLDDKVLAGDNILTSQDTPAGNEKLKIEWTAIDLLRSLFSDDFFGNDVDLDIWNVTIVGGGGVAISNNDIGGVVEISTGNVSADSGQLDLGKTQFKANKSGVVDFDNILTSITDVKVQCGFLQDSNNWARFEYDSASSANWQAVTKKSGMSNTIDTGIAADTSDHTFRVELNSATEVKYYIDDSLVATSTSNVPTSSLFLFFFIENSAAANKVFKMDWVLAKSDR